MPLQSLTRDRASGVVKGPSDATDPGREAVKVFTPKRFALVVDDDPAIPPLVELALAPYEFKVDAVPDGASALVRLRARAYDLVILDLVMVELDGFEVLQTMKRAPPLRGIPVIVLTADQSEQTVARSFGFGADDIVTKPFRLNELGMRAYRLTQPFPNRGAGHGNTSGRRAGRG